MSDLYRRITDEEWEQIPKHERAGYKVSDGVLVKVNPTDRICLRHQQLPPNGSRSKRCYMGDAIGEDCNIVDVVRMETE